MEDAGEVELAEHRCTGHVIDGDLLAEVLVHALDHSQYGSLDYFVHQSSGVIEEGETSNPE
ncbi:hypothetical protein Pta02_41610 [Planobispora takensis]|uniref:Uncharacterized protein n=1 Tax=Planobispora takensis TaxID=1367882 RepID=A0A8J3WUZ5_9ACTN|nr:hypothetical protein Pta02_41610 [Planobispora takensis]